MKNLILLFLLSFLFATISLAQNLSIDRSYFKPGEQIQVRFTAPGGYASNAWIGIIPSNISHGSELVNDQNDLTYQYLSGKTSGTFLFTAPVNTGSYDFRMNDNDSNGKEVASVSFVVSYEVPVAQPTQTANMGSGNLSLSKTSFSPGENITISFTAPSGLPSNAWIGIIPSTITHGSEEVNDQNDITYQYLSGKTSGTMIFKAPDKVGNWDFRMNSDDNGGKELGSVSFFVGGSSYTGNNPQPSNNSGQASQTSLPAPEGTVVFDNWNKSTVYNSPAGPTYFYLAKQTTITRITNYHWNNSNGQTPGQIGIKGADGRNYGSWNAIGTSGTGGAQNVGWVVMPNINLSPGLYEITDSDKGTWSQNTGSFGCGFTSILGK